MNYLYSTMMYINVLWTQMSRQWMYMADRRSKGFMDGVHEFIEAAEKHKYGVSFFVHAPVGLTNRYLRPLGYISSCLVSFFLTCSFHCRPSRRPRSSAVATSDDRPPPPPGRPLLPPRHLDLFPPRRRRLDAWPPPPNPSWCAAAASASASTPAHPPLHAATSVRLSPAASTGTPPLLSIPPQSEPPLSSLRPGTPPAIAIATAEHHPAAEHPSPVTPRP